MSKRLPQIDSTDDYDEGSRRSHSSKRAREQEIKRFVMSKRLPQIDSTDDYDEGSRRSHSREIEICDIQTSSTNLKQRVQDVLFVSLT